MDRAVRFSNRLAGKRNVGNPVAFKRKTAGTIAAKQNKFPFKNSLRKKPAAKVLKKSVRLQNKRIDTQPEEPECEEEDEIIEIETVIKKVPDYSVMQKETVTVRLRKGSENKAGKKSVENVSKDVSRREKTDDTFSKESAPPQKNETKALSSERPSAKGTTKEKSAPQRKPTRGGSSMFSQLLSAHDYFATKKEPLAKEPSSAYKTSLKSISKYLPPGTSSPRGNKLSASEDIASQKKKINPVYKSSLERVSKYASPERKTSVERIPEEQPSKRKIAAEQKISVHCHFSKKSVPQKAKSVHTHASIVDNSRKGTSSKFSESLKGSSKFGKKSQDAYTKRNSKSYETDSWAVVNPKRSSRKDQNWYGGRNSSKSRKAKKRDYAGNYKEKDTEQRYRKGRSGQVIRHSLKKNSERESKTVSIIPTVALKKVKYSGKNVKSGIPVGFRYFKVKYLSFKRFGFFKPKRYFANSVRTEINCQLAIVKEVTASVPMKDETIDMISDMKRLESFNLKRPATRKQLSNKVSARVPGARKISDKVEKLKSNGRKERMPDEIESEMIEETVDILEEIDSDVEEIEVLEDVEEIETEEEIVTDTMEESENDLVNSEGNDEIVREMEIDTKNKLGATKGKNTESESSAKFKNDSSAIATGVKESADAKEVPKKVSTGPRTYKKYLNKDSENKIYQDFVECQAALNKWKSHLIGLEYVIEVRENLDMKKALDYHCGLCEEALSPLDISGQNVLNHINSYKHMNQYMAKHFPTCGINFSTSVENYNNIYVLQKCCEEINNELGFQLMCVTSNDYFKEHYDDIKNIQNDMMHWKQKNVSIDAVSILNQLNSVIDNDVDDVAISMLCEIFPDEYKKQSDASQELTKISCNSEGNLIRKLISNPVRSSKRFPANVNKENLLEIVIQDSPPIKVNAVDQKSDSVDSDNIVSDVKQKVSVKKSAKCSKILPLKKSAAKFNFSSALKRYRPRNAARVIVKQKVIKGSTGIEKTFDENVIQEADVIDEDSEDEVILVESNNDVSEKDAIEEETVDTSKATRRVSRKVEPKKTTFRNKIPQSKTLSRNKKSDFKKLNDSLKTIGAEGVELGKSSGETGESEVQEIIFELDDDKNFDENESSDCQKETRKIVPDRSSTDKSNVSKLQYKDKHKGHQKTTQHSKYCLKMIKTRNLNRIKETENLGPIGRFVTASDERIPSSLLASYKRSPIRRRSRSPQRRSRSPRKRESRSPVRRSARSPIRKRSRSPKRLRSPYRRRSRSPIRRRSSPRRRSRSPIRYRSRSPIRRRSRSPLRKRSRSPIRKRSRSPLRQRSRSPLKRFSRSPLKRFSRSPLKRFSRSPIRRRSRSPVGRRSRSPIRRRSRSPLPGLKHFGRQSRSPIRNRVENMRIYLSPARNLPEEEEKIPYRAPRSPIRKVERKFDDIPSNLLKHDSSRNISYKPFGPPKNPVSSYPSRSNADLDPVSDDDDSAYFNAMERPNHLEEIKNLPEPTRSMITQLLQAFSISKINTNDPTFFELMQFVNENSAQLEKLIEKKTSLKSFTYPVTEPSAKAPSRNAMLQQYLISSLAENAGHLATFSNQPPNIFPAPSQLGVAPFPPPVNPRIPYPPPMSGLPSTSFQHPTFQPVSPPRPQLPFIVTPPQVHPQMFGNRPPLPAQMHLPPPQQFNTFNPPRMEIPQATPNPKVFKDLKATVNKLFGSNQKNSNESVNISPFNIEQNTKAQHKMNRENPPQMRRENPQQMHRENPQQMRRENPQQMRRENPPQMRRENPPQMRIPPPDAKVNFFDRSQSTSQRNLFPVLNPNERASRSSNKTAADFNEAKISLAQRLAAVLIKVGMVDVTAALLQEMLMKIGAFSSSLPQDINESEILDILKKLGYIK